jgi:nucleotide-binding universal stress UspA family protein
MRWLISTDGTPRAHAAAKFAASLIKPGDEVVLLGVLNRTRAGEHELLKSVDALSEILNYTVTRKIIREGSIISAIEDVAGREPFNIALYASRGRRGISKLLLGSVAARLAHEMPCSVLIVRKPPETLKKILISTTLSEGHDLPIEKGIMLAKIAGAEVTVLHVMSQIALDDGFYVGQLRLTAEEAITQQTREGMGFKRILESADRQGVNAQVRIRYGLVEDEIVKEVVDGNYDLLVLGAHTTPEERRWEELLLEDVTNTVLLDTRCPVLIVRKEKPAGKGLSRAGKTTSQ